MSAYAAFRRQPVDPQVAQNLRTITIPAPTRGLIFAENDAFMQPGGAIVQVNWATTMKGVKLRGGCARHCVLPETSPIISGFEYISAATQRMYAANATKLYDVTTSTPILIKSGQASGNYVAAQMSNNAGVVYMLVANDAGDFLLRTADGITFTTLSGVIGNAGDGIPNITYDPDKLPAGVPQGTGLTYVWKYRNRVYFIQKNSMTAWYLENIDAVGGVLKPIYMAGAASKGGKLLFGATWSIDAGDGIDDKCVFVTDLGEVLIFTGSNPGDSTNWRQEGRYQIAPPLGMNAHIVIGGDLMILTTEGIVPLSQAISKDSGALDLALLTRNIKPLWRDEVVAKRAWPWSIEKWDEYGGIFVAAPGGTHPGNTRCLVANNATGAWFIFTWDVTCLMRLREAMFFGTQKGIVMQAERGGTDDGQPYTATLVGGWETFRSGAAQVVWHQARAIFTARHNEPFQPQLAATVDYTLVIPPPPEVGPDPGTADVWDEGLWGPPGSGNILPVPPADIAAYAQWDQPMADKPSMQNTMWQSIGMSGFAHAPIVQVQVGQTRRPEVELIAIGTTQESGGVNV
jgi:hypothetical protein